VIVNSTHPKAKPLSRGNGTLTTCKFIEQEERKKALTRKKESLQGGGINVKLLSIFTSLSQILSAWVVQVSGFG
jgi:hypothetical protein